MRRGIPLAILFLPLLLTCCSDRDVPRPVPVPAPEARTSPAAADPDDPGEPGISDLARLARYVYKAMQRHEEVCPFANPYRERLHFALTVEVDGGKITRARLGHVSVDRAEGGEPKPLRRGQWPRELAGYVDCLAPHLQAVRMEPAPADGAYEPSYAHSGRPDGRPAPRTSPADR